MSSLSKDSLTYGADNDTTVGGSEESHSMSRDGGEVGEGEQEDEPHRAGFHNATDSYKATTLYQFFGNCWKFLEKFSHQMAKM